MSRARQPAARAPDRSQRASGSRPAAPRGCGLASPGRTRPGGVSALIAAGRRPTASKARAACCCVPPCAPALREAVSVADTGASLRRGVARNDHILPSAADPRATAIASPARYWWWRLCGRVRSVNMRTCADAHIPGATVSENGGPACLRVRQTAPTPASAVVLGEDVRLRRRRSLRGNVEIAGSDAFGSTPSRSDWRRHRWTATGGLLKMIAWLVTCW